MIICLLFSAIGARELVALIVEQNLTVDLLDSLLNAREHLPDETPIILITKRVNWKYFEQPFWRKKNLVVEKRFRVPTSSKDYSRLMQSCLMLDSLNATFVLVFQADTRFCSTSPYNVSAFAAMNYAYIGAPWQSPVVAGSRVGNGGFSLRRVDAAKACCIERPPSDVVLYHPEDLAVIRCLAKKRYLLAPFAVAETFSSESYLVATATVAPMAVHKVHHANHNGANLQKLTDLCPEVRTLALVRPQW